MFIAPTRKNDPELRVRSPRVSKGSLTKVPSLTVGLLTRSVPTELRQKLARRNRASLANHLKRRRPIATSAEMANRAILRRRVSSDALHDINHIGFLDTSSDTRSRADSGDELRDSVIARD